MKKLLVLTTNKKLAESIKSKIKNTQTDVFEQMPSNIDDYDLIALSTPIQTDIRGHNIIRLHQSLLPAFNSSKPVQDAYMAGVKVTGITVHRVENDDMSGKILAQYPVIIDNYTHYDQLEDEINELSRKLYPLVIKSILEDKVFDIVDFLSDKPNHTCGGCGNCGNCH